MDGNLSTTRTIIPITSSMPRIHLPAGDLPVFIDYSRWLADSFDTAISHIRTSLELISNMLMKSPANRCERLSMLKGFGLIGSFKFTL